MRLNWKFIWLCLPVAMLALGTAGCGGITARKTVSPLDFIMPGILKNDAPASCTNAPAVLVEPSVQLASVR